MRYVTFQQYCVFRVGEFDVCGVARDDENRHLGTIFKDHATVIGTCKVQILKGFAVSLANHRKAEGLRSLRSTQTLTRRNARDEFPIFGHFENGVCGRNGHRYCVMCL